MDCGSSRLASDQLQGKTHPGPGTFRIFSPTLPLDPANTESIAAALPFHGGFRIVANHPLIEEGRASGEFTKTPASGVNGASFELDGIIDLFGFGTFDFSGQILAAGFDRASASGQLSLSTEVGTITIALVGSDQDVLDGLPGEMGFTVADSTGVYARASGSGVVRFIPAPADCESSGSIHLALT